MANREIEARLKMTAVDQASRVIDRLGGRIDAINKKMEAVNRRSAAANNAERAAAQAAAKAEKNRALLLGAGAAAAYVATRGAKEAFVNFAELERRMTRVGNTAGVSREEIEKATDAIFDMAQKTAMPFDQAIEGLDGLVASGMSLERALSFLPSVLRVAQATGAETADLAQVAASFSNAMGIAATDMEKAFNAAAQAGNLGAFELKDMARELPSILPLMRQAGYDGLEGVKRATAMLQTTMLGAGTAEEAATNLKNVLLKMEAPQTSRYFKKTYGIDLPKYLDEAVRKGKDRVEAFIDLATKVSKGSTTAWQALFPDAQFNQGATALRDYIGKLHEYLKELEGGADVVGEQYAKVMADTQAKIDKLSNSWGMFQRSLGATVASIGVTEQIDVLSQDLRDITKLADAWRGGEDTGDAWNTISVHGLERDFPGAKAAAEAYRAQTGGKEPPAELLRPYMGGIVDRFWLTDERRRELEEQGKAAGTAAGAAALTESQIAARERQAYVMRQYGARLLTGAQTLSEPVRGEPMVGVLPGGAEPFGAQTFADGERYIPMNDPGIELPGSYPNSGLSVPVIDGSMGELKERLVGLMDDAKEEVLLSASDMLKQLVTMIGNTPLPPIKIRVDGQTQLARVNPGVSMPDDK